MNKIGKLREVKDEELETMLSWRNAPNVRKNMYTQHEISLNEHLTWWERTQRRSDQKYFMFEDDGVSYGIVGFNGIDLINKNSSWAFYASPDAPRGTGSRMEFLAIEYAFNELELHKLSCEVLSYNAPVIKLHQKFGFKVEGVLREQYKLDETFIDICQLGILAHEWHEHRQVVLEKLVRLLGDNNE